MKPTFGLVVLVIGVLIVFGTTGCQSSGDSETGELFDMTRIDTGDDTYEDGVAYTVTVSLTDSGAYTYAFVFTDGGGKTAVGIPALEKTLIVP